MNLRPITQDEARHFIARRHRHSRRAPQRMICCVGIEQDGELVGVGMLERPKAPRLCDGVTVEITRVCTDGARNGCSMIYGALCRAAKALGYRRAITYTLATESGASLKASGFTATHSYPGKTWEQRREVQGNVQPDFFGDAFGVALARVRWERRLTPTPEQGKG